jgi:hypothetical protein
MEREFLLPNVHEPATGSYPVTDASLTSGLQLIINCEHERLQ